MSECRIQIPGTKKYRLEGPRRRPDNIGQISKENLCYHQYSEWTGSACAASNHTHVNRMQVHAEQWWMLRVAARLKHEHEAPVVW